MFEQSIDYSAKIIPCDKSIEEIAHENYKRLESTRAFNIGDKVNVIINENYPNKKVIKHLKNKEFNIIDVAIDWTLDTELFYVLDTEIDIKYFKPKQLKRV